MAGILTTPDACAPVAAVLMLHGSGPLDRDDHSPSFLRYCAILTKPVDQRVMDLTRAWILSH